MKESNRKIKVLTAKPGLDGHDTGILVVSKALRDAGMEVIYLGLHQTPERIVEAAIQEDVDVIGVSSLSDTHMEMSQRILDLLSKKGISDMLLIVGGIYDNDNVDQLKGMGVGAFAVDTKLDDIISFVKANVRK